MASPRSWERITFRDTRGLVPRAEAVHVRDITWTTKKDRKGAITRAAASVWAGVPLTIDHAAATVFAADPFDASRLARAGDFTARLISADEAAL